MMSATLKLCDEQFICLPTYIFIQIEHNNVEYKLVCEFKRLACARVSRAIGQKKTRIPHAYNMLCDVDIIYIVKC